MDLGAESRCGDWLDESMDNLERRGVSWIGRYG